MAKKHKKRKKLSRRDRQRAAAQGTPVAKSASPKPGKEAAQSEPAARRVPVHLPPSAGSAERPPKQSDERPAVTATFTPNRPAAGTPADAAEFTAVRRDLRKLGLTIVVFAGLIAGLAWLNAATGVIGDLGQTMFGWWQ